MIENANVKIAFALLVLPVMAIAAVVGIVAISVAVRAFLNGPMWATRSGPRRVVKTRTCDTPPRIP